MSSLQFSQLHIGKPIRVEVDGEWVCVARVGDEVYAIDDTCSHSDASLSEGELNGFKIECWLHGAEFDIRTGEVLTPPATQDVKSYHIDREGDQLTIKKAN